MAETSAPLPRVYFDSNEVTEHNVFGLWLEKSKGDLAKIPGGPKAGMKVTIYMIAEIEMEAILEWNQRWNGWTAREVAGTIRPNHETWE